MGLRRGLSGWSSPTICSGAAGPCSSGSASRSRSSSGWRCGASARSSPRSPTGSRRSLPGARRAALHRFLAAYVKYATHVYAYLFLAAEPLPGFDGRPGYPVDVEIAPPARQNRWTVGFRLVLAIPALLLAASLVWRHSRRRQRDLRPRIAARLRAARRSPPSSAGSAALARARMPRGLRDAPPTGSPTPRSSGPTCCCSPTATPTATR